MAAEDDDTDMNEEDGVPKSMRGGIDNCGCWLNGECDDIGMIDRYSKCDGLSFWRRRAAMFATIISTCLFDEWGSRLRPLGRSQCSPAISQPRRWSVDLERAPSRYFVPVLNACCVDALAV